MSSFAIRKELTSTFDEALARLPEALASQGFGILSEIDVSATLQKKLGVDFRRYRIFGACNPALAHQALSAIVDIGVMLPCNVVLYEDDNGRAVALAVDPLRTIGTTGATELGDVAATVKAKLEAALSALG